MGSTSRHSIALGASQCATADPPLRPRVLFLACHLAWPPISGGRRRELELIKRLSPRFDVHLLVVSKTPADDRANASKLAEWCRSVDVFAAEPIVGEIPGRQCTQLLRHRCRAASRRVREILVIGDVDLVHVEGFYLMQHLPSWADVPVLLVEQNVEYEVERQRARFTTGGPPRLDSLVRCERTRDAELDCWRRATRLATVTWEDREAVRNEVPEVRVSVVPDGADHIPDGADHIGADHIPDGTDHIPDGADHITDPVTTGGNGGWGATGDVAAPPPRPRVPLVLLLANFGYAPNVDAALHFARDILPAVTSAVPNVQVWLVGNEPPAAVRGLEDDRITVTGYVPDVLPYLDAAAAVVCPLRIGGGIKVKMLEALRRGKAIVSTSVGAQGLATQAREAVLVADEPDDFARALTRLLVDDRQRSRLELAASRAGGGLPTWDDSVRVLSALYDELIGHQSSTLEPASVLAGWSR